MPSTTYPNTSRWHVDQQHQWDLKIGGPHVTAAVKKGEYALESDPFIGRFTEEGDGSAAASSAMITPAKGFAPGARGDSFHGLLGSGFLDRALRLCWRLQLARCWSGFWQTGVWGLGLSVRALWIRGPNLAILSLLYGLSWVRDAERSCGEST